MRRSEWIGPPFESPVNGTLVNAAPVINAQGHHFDGRLIIVDADILIVGVHHRRRTWSKDYRRRLAVKIEEASIGCALPPADLWIAPSNLLIVLAHHFDDRVINRNFRCLRVVTYEANDRRVSLHPRILRRKLCDVIDQRFLNAFMIFTWNRRHAALERTGRRERARVVARMKCADHARQRVDRLRIQRMLYARDTFVLERRHRFDDLIADLDGADALIAALNAGRLPLYVDLEPNAADAGWLDREAAGLTGDAGVGRIAANYRIKCPVAADLLVDHDVEVYIAFRL